MRPSGRAAALLLTLLIAHAHVAAGAGADATPNNADGVLPWLETPLGRLDYRPGRGLRVGDTGLVLGGFATAEAERLEGGDSGGGLDGVNFLIFFDPVPFLHIFSELELAQPLRFDSGRQGPDTFNGVDVDRLYGDLALNDLLNVRAGKFLTPFGRWNQAAADPLVWTASEPMIVEEVFDELVTGAMLFGTVFPRESSLTYSLYGQFFDPLDPDPDRPPADHNAGTRLEYASLDGWALGASYFASKKSRREWNHVAGADGLWRPDRRLELTAEILAGEGTQQQGGQWGLFTQGVFEIVPTFNLVARYEYYDPPDPEERAVHAVDVGFAWVPVYYLRFKADYRFADHLTESSAPGLRAAFSILF